VNRGRENADQDWISGVIHILSYREGELLAILFAVGGRRDAEATMGIGKGGLSIPCT